ncbi:MAG: cell wall-active antibiotics response protein [Clostridiales bacterium]|nr:cell wall-active antibiotics response protein [Clostridiales bacterium]
MSNRISNMLWGLVFIVLGMAIAAKSIWDVDIFFKGWWTLFIIVPSFIGMLKSRFGVGSTVTFIVGVYLLLASQPVFGFGVRKLLLPTIFIFIGLRIIFQSAGYKRYRLEYKGEPGQNNNVEGEVIYNQDVYRDDGARNDGLPEYNATFTSNSINIQNNFYGASLNSVFGSLVLDLRNASINHDVEINATAIFAGIDIYIPENVNIKINSVPIFGGVSNKVNRPYNHELPTIYLSSTCMFGGIDIK